MGLGETLRNARIQKGLSPSDVAENTHMMVQIVEDLEREDFRRIAAPIYGRGFVRLYAELLELDPEPLIRDFMEHFTGARSPSVRTKPVETPVEQPPVRPPVPRVSAPLAPPRPPIQPKPLVRPLSAPLSAEEPVPAHLPPEEGPSAAPAARAEEPEPASELPDEAGDTLSIRAEAMPEQSRHEDFSDSDWVADPPSAAQVPLVVEPEEPYAESDEPDLFHPRPLRPAPSVTTDEAADEKPEGHTMASRLLRKLKHPVFKIGGRLEPEEPAPLVADPEAHARREARIQSFVNGFGKLKEGIERKLPAALPRKQMLVLSGAGLVLVVCMGIGIHVLFRLTGSNVKTTPGVLIESVPPPPDLYVD